MPTHPAAGRGGGFSATLSLQRESEQRYGRSFGSLDVKVVPETPERLRVRVAPRGGRRWEVPESIVQRCVAQAQSTATVCSCCAVALGCAPLTLTRKGAFCACAAARRPGVQPGLRAEELLYAVDAPAQSGAPFALTVRRRGSNMPIFDSRGYR